MDTLTPDQRSERMSRVRGKGTKPEMKVRRIIHAMGYRYRLHARNLPGHPDLVFSGRKKVIFVHGCFWHRHEGCGRLPKSRLDFWAPKLESNKTRDLDNQQLLRGMGWSFLVIWECEIKDTDAVAQRLKDFLEDRASSPSSRPLPDTQPGPKAEVTTPPGLPPGPIG